MAGWGGEDDVRRLLADGDAHAVLGWLPSAVLVFRSAPASPEEAGLLAADLCALANSARGGTMVVGVRAEPGGSTLLPFARDHHADAVERLVRERLFPVPERVTVTHVPVNGADVEGLGILVVRIPAQDDLLRPFVMYESATVGDGNLGMRITVVERDGAETIARSVAAVHAALCAGTAFLRGKPGSGAP
jgi:hypothetical protein